MGGVGGPPGLLTVVFGTAPFVAAAPSSFLLTGGEGSFLTPALLEEALVAPDVSL